MLNLVIIEGTLTENPIKSVTKNAKPVAELKLQNTSKSGTFERKLFITVTCYGRAYEAVNGLSRDQKVTVQGTLTSWKGKDEKWHVGIQANEIHGAGETKPSWDNVANESDVPPF